MSHEDEGNVLKSLCVCVEREGRWSGRASAEVYAQASQEHSE